MTDHASSRTASNLICGNVPAGSVFRLVQTMTTNNALASNVDPTSHTCINRPIRFSNSILRSATSSSWLRPGPSSASNTAKLISRRILTSRAFVRIPCPKSDAISVSSTRSSIIVSPPSNCPRPLFLRPELGTPGCFRVAKQILQKRSGAFLPYGRIYPKC